MANKQPNLWTKLKFWNRDHTTNYQTVWFGKRDWLWWVSSVLTSLIIILMIVFLAFIIIFSVPFFKSQSFSSFFGTYWDPRKNSYGIFNFLISTFWTIFLRYC